MFYILTGGKHAFGAVAWERQSKIMGGTYDISDLRDNVACDLFARMACVEPKERLEIGLVLEHPALWEAEQKLRKICEWKDSWVKNSPPLKRKLQVHKAAVQRM